MNRARLIGLMIVLTSRFLPAAGQPNCGVDCLYTALLALDVEVPSLDVLEKKLGPPPAAGYSFGQLAEVARLFGVEAVGVTTTLERLAARQERFSAIAHWKDGHFVTLGAVGVNGVTYADGAVVRTVATPTFLSQWDRKVLLLSREPIIPEEDLILASSDGGWGRIGLWLVAAIGGGLVFVLTWRRARHT